MTVARRQKGAFKMLSEDSVGTEVKTEKEELEWLRKS